MPKASTNVLSTDREVQAAMASSTRAEFRIKGARNLVLRITPAGAKAWAFLYASPTTGQRRKLSLGTYPAKTLAAAKDEALRLGVAVRDGKDPLLTRSEEEAAETFSSLARRYMIEHERKHARAGQPSRSTREAQRLLDADILPALGRHKAAAVQRQHVMTIVDAITDRGSYVVADRVLGLVRAIFNWAIGKGRLEANPTLGLKKRNTSRPRERVFTSPEIRILWSALEAAQTTSTEICDALRLQLLLGLRIGEALGAAKSEIDLGRRIWTIPALRT
ncbi:MAG TPA: integrase arm-type DNA-binding domain-containing protein, partial [Methyloceanibacter sp.]